MRKLIIPSPISMALQRWKWAVEPLFQELFPGLTGQAVLTLSRQKPIRKVEQIIQFRASLLFLVYHLLCTPPIHLQGLRVLPVSRVLRGLPDRTALRVLRVLQALRVRKDLPDLRDLPDHRACREKPELRDLPELP
jgi:hypothetical protein